MLFLMGKRKIVKQYAHFSKAQNPVKLPDFDKDGQYDYFKAEFYPFKGI